MPAGKAAATLAWFTVTVPSTTGPDASGAASTGGGAASISGGASTGATYASCGAAASAGGPPIPEEPDPPHAAAAASSIGVTPVRTFCRIGKAMLEVVNHGGRTRQAARYEIVPHALGFFWRKCHVFRFATRYAACST